MFVLDCSVTLAWCFQDETNPYADDVLERLNLESAVVPSLWPLEVSNVLLVGIRKKRLEPPDARRFFSLLAGLQIEIDSQTHQYASQQIFELGLQWQLSSYDSAYLELALRKNCPLATADRALKKAATALGVALVS
ncbi:MAG: type II toxin-antitoxin system VapC family toxin [SAR324 cluster bacterium]|nr:type II toxin-antitoxin system VapC family toxin [SAR324 cluster bacterium]